MARAKVVHSADACEVIVKGDKKSPEPSTVAIKFPGGHVEVSRTTSGSYWVHIGVDEPENIVDSRIDYDYEGNKKAKVKIPSIPLQEHIKHMAVEVKGPYRSTETL